MADAPTAVTLLADAAWLKRLALTLASNEDDAEDLVQESWIAVWQQQPSTDRSLRPWLSKVVRDLSKMRRRGEQRRASREKAIDEARAVMPPDALLEQVRLHRVLVDLVLELDEPFRATVIARFVEGRTAASIARSLSLPESTVRWRLREALARLRVQLDKKSGDRKVWAPAVLAFGKRGLQVAKPAKTLAVILGLLALLIGGVIATVGLRTSKSTAREEGSPGQVGSHRSTSASRALDDEKLAKVLASGKAPGWLSQPGVSGRRIAGVVLVDGAPSAGAIVHLTSEQSLAGFVTAGEQQTDADGRFDFGVQVATRYAVGAVAPGRVATVKHVDLRDPQAHPESTILLLDPCVVGFFGKVTDANGSPIPHAELLAQDVVGTETDQVGSFDICLHAQGTPKDLRLVVRASGYGGVELEANLSGRIHHDFILSPEGVVFGRAITAQGEPVANAEIRFAWDEATPRPGSEQPAVVRAVTGPDGRFQAAGLAAGRQRVVAYARAAAATPFTIEVAPGESEEIVVSMSERAVVRGTVLLDGKPVAGVTVRNRKETPTYQARDEMAPAGSEAVSQADGTFVLDGVTLGEVSFSTTPYRLLTPKTVLVVAGEQNVTLEVEALGRIVGTVRRHGKPMPHTLVQASHSSGWVGRSTTETDESGRFELRGLDVGDYSVLASNATVGAFAGVAKVHVEVDKPQQVDIDLVFGARIAGTVEDKQGAPVSGAFVQFADAKTGDLGQCISDTAGRFDCGSMTGEGSYQVTVKASQASASAFRFVDPPPTPISLADGDSRVDGVRLVVEVEKLAIKGTVVSSAGAAVADAQVRVVADGDAWIPVPTTTTNTAGQFEVGDLSSGDYSLEVLGPDNSRTRTPPVPAGSESVRVVLEPQTCAVDIDPSVGSVSRGEPADISRPEGRIVWDDRIELVGWKGPQHVRLGDDFQMMLVYRVVQPIDRSWKIFIHLVSPTRQATADHDPVGGRCPTSTWRKGDIIVDRYTTRIDPADGAGEYHIWTGFFTGWGQAWRNMQVTQALADARDTHERLRVTSIVADQDPSSQIESWR